MSPPKPLKIFIHSMDGTGHINACVGLGQALQKRGHRIQFLVNVAFKGQLSIYGFEELLLVPDPSPEAPKSSEPAGPEQENPVKMIAKQLLGSGLLSDKDSTEKMRLMKDSDFMEELYQKAVEFNPKIGGFIAAEKPDLIIVDHFMVPPAVLEARVPYLLIYSGNPLLLHNSEKLPPSCSGYAIDSDPSTWTEYRAVLQEAFIDAMRNFQLRLNAHFNFCQPELENSTEFTSSPYLNIYQYPKELDYLDQVPLKETLAQVDAFCRESPEPFELPKEFPVKTEDKLIYVSMGSMGSIDVELNKRIAEALAKTPYKCIFSKGPLADEYELPANSWGQAFLPQTRILPLVDLVITHGGNNTVTETFNFGKPMIVLPLFADQFDNAQRIQELGYGVRLEPYSFEPQELVKAVDRLLGDEKLKKRLLAAAERIEKSNSKERVCERIEQLVEKFVKSH